MKETWKKFDKLNVYANFCVEYQGQTDVLMLKWLRPQARMTN